ALASGYVAQLWPGEVRVQVQDAGTDLGRGEGDVEEAAVVSAQDAHDVALAHSARPQRARQRIGPGMEVVKGQGPQLVAQSRSLAVPDGGHRYRPPELSQATDGPEDLQRARGRIEADHPRAPHVSQGTRLHRGPPAQLRYPRDHQPISTRDTIAPSIPN